MKLLPVTRAAHLRFGILAVGGAVILACLSLLPSQSLLAHAGLTKAEPSPNSVLENPPLMVTIWFTEDIEPRYSEIQVLDTQGARVDNADSKVRENDPSVMSVTLQPLSQGIYNVVWRNASTVDGHALSGSYLFSVKQPFATNAGPGGLTQSRSQSPAEPIFRWLILLSIITTTGGLIFEFTVWRPVLSKRAGGEASQKILSLMEEQTYRVSWIALIVFLIASWGQLLDHTAELEGIAWYRSFGHPSAIMVTQTEWGRLWLWRIALLIVVAGLLDASALLKKGSAAKGLLKILTPLATVGLLLVLSMGSHGAGIIEIRQGAVFTDYLHLLAAAIWIGGIIHFALTIPLLIRNLPTEERGMVLSQMVPRFSTVGILSVGTLIITGIYNSWAQVTTLSALDTPYGWTLLAKIAVLIPILLLGSLNLVRVCPRLDSEERAKIWLRRFVTVEAILATLLLLLVGLLTSTEPARQAASLRIPQPKNLTFKDTVEGANIVMKIDPGSLGTNLFTIFLTDRLGNPIANATAVTLQLTYLDQPIPPSSPPALDHGGGVWVVHEGVLSIAGTWRASLTVQRPDAFDARTNFRFRIASKPESLAITPSAKAAKPMLGLELSIVGILFLGVGLAMGGWRSRTGIGIMTPGVVALLAGLLLVSGIL